MLKNCKKRYCENFTKILIIADETIAFIQDIKKTDCSFTTRNLKKEPQHTLENIKNEKHNFTKTVFLGKKT